jgi:hypothetical protein
MLFILSKILRKFIARFFGAWFRPEILRFHRYARVAIFEREKQKAKMMTKAIKIVSKV